MTKRKCEDFVDLWFRQYDNMKKNSNYVYIPFENNIISLNNAVYEHQNFIHKYVKYVNNKGIS